MSSPNVQASVLGFEYCPKKDNTFRLLKHCSPKDGRVNLSILIRIRLKEFESGSLSLSLAKPLEANEDDLDKDSNGAFESLELLSIPLDEKSIEKGSLYGQTEKLPFDEYPIKYECILNATEVPCVGSGVYGIVLSESGNWHRIYDAYYFRIS